jgi:cation:H+ antiporter
VSGFALPLLMVMLMLTRFAPRSSGSPASASHNIGVATGNILGGIAIQTLVLVALDVFGGDRRQSLTYRAASLGLVLDGGLVIAVLTVAVMGSQLPAGPAQVRS